MSSRQFWGLPRGSSFNSSKINGKNVCTFEINVPSKNFEKNLNTGITTDHCDLLTGQIFEDLIACFLESETIGITRFYKMMFMIGENITGVDVIDNKGSSILINFLCTGGLFSKQVEQYNAKLNEYEQQQLASHPQIKRKDKIKLEKNLKLTKV